MFGIVSQEKLGVLLGLIYLLIGILILCALLRHFVEAIWLSYVEAILPKRFLFVCLSDSFDHSDADYSFDDELFIQNAVLVASKDFIKENDTSTKTTTT